MHVSVDDDASSHEHCSIARVGAPQLTAYVRTIEPDVSTNASFWLICGTMCWPVALTSHAPPGRLLCTTARLLAPLAAMLVPKYSMPSLARKIDLKCGFHEPKPSVLSLLVVSVCTPDCAHTHRRCARTQRTNRRTTSMQSTVKMLHCDQNGPLQMHGDRVGERSVDDLKRDECRQLELLKADGERGGGVADHRERRGGGKDLAQSRPHVVVLQVLNGQGVANELWRLSADKKDLRPPHVDLCRRRHAVKRQWEPRELIVAQLRARQHVSDERGPVSERSHPKRVEQRQLAQLGRQRRENVGIELHSTRVSAVQAVNQRARRTESTCNERSAPISRGTLAMRFLCKYSKVSAVSCPMRDGIDVKRFAPTSRNVSCGIRKAPAGMEDSALECSCNDLTQVN